MKKAEMQAAASQFRPIQFLRTFSPTWINVVYWNAQSYSNRKYTYQIRL